MKKACDKCKSAQAKISYTETINGKTKHLDLCENCANEIVEEKERFLSSFFNLDPFREVDQMFDSMFGIPKLTSAKQSKPAKQPRPPIKPSAKPPRAQINEKEEKLKQLKTAVDKLKQEEGIAVMLQDYLKAAEIKKKREKLQKEAGKIAFG